MKKSLLSIVLSISLLLAFVAGCGQSSTANVQQIKLFDGKSGNFKIVRSETADNDVIAVGRYMRQALIDTHDITVDFINDSFAQQEGQLEISIGLTNRPKAQAIYDEIVNAYPNHAMDYSIIVDGNVIYIVGATSIALQKGAEAFLSYFCATTDGSVAENFEYRYHPGNNGKSFAIAGETNLSAYQIVVPKYNMSYIIGREVDSLCDELILATGSDVPKVPDSADEAEYEIIIGSTKRGGTPMPTNTDEYIIKISGTKLHIAGGSDAATAMGVRELISWVQDSKHLPKDLNYTGSYSYAVKNLDNPYKLVWSDEFDSVLDTSVWTIQSGTYAPNENILPRQKKFVDTAENLKIENGKLVMKATYDDEFYYGVELRTARSLWMKYGIIEISCKFNISKGICPAFWLLGNASSAIHGEFDAFEAFGDYCGETNSIKGTPLTHPTEESGYKSGTIYNGAIQDDEESFYFLQDGDTFDDEFHTIGLEWTPTTLKWVYDGSVFLEVDTTQDELSYYTYNGMMYLILTHYSGNDVCSPYTGLPDATTDWENNHFTVDSIRLYQNSDGVFQLK